MDMQHQQQQGEAQVPQQLSKEAAAELERQQEALLLQKYGGIKPKKHLLQHKKTSRKCFDSADWALAKEGQPSEEPLLQPIETLPVKLQPTTPVVPRRHSNLGEC